MGARNKQNSKSLDSIVETLLHSVEISKKEIFTIAETSRNEYESVLVQLENLKSEIRSLIDRNDALHISLKKARHNLAKVSQDFSGRREERLEEAYKRTNELQVEYVQMFEREQQQKKQRDELERRLIRISDYIEKADNLGTQMSIISQYLSADMAEMNQFFISAQEKQKLGLRLLEVQEEERKSLSREIHDGPAQMLANVLLRSDIIEKTFKERGSDAAIQEIRATRQMIREALSEVRRIIYNLRPMALDDLGLIPTLRKHIDTMKAITESELLLQVIGTQKRLPSTYEVALFRITQEGLQNAVKHAQAESVLVKLEILRDKVILIIKDDGIGFDVTQKKDGSYGLLGIQERLEVLNGTLECTSTIGLGTRVYIEIPVDDDIDFED